MRKLDKTETLVTIGDMTYVREEINLLVYISSLTQFAYFLSLFEQVSLLSKQFNPFNRYFQSEDIFSYLKTTVYSCYSCSRQEGAQVFSSSQLSTQANIRFPLKYTVSLVSVFLVDNPIIYLFSTVKLLFTVCFILSQSKNIFSYLKTTVYSCYSCSRQEGAQFFSSSRLSTQANIRFPLKYTVSLVSVFW